MSAMSIGISISHSDLVGVAASYTHHSYSYSCSILNMSSKSAKRRSLFGVDNLALESESDTETIIYDSDESSDGAENL